MIKKDHQGMNMRYISPIFRTSLIALMVALCSQAAKAQLTPFQQMYFQNPYQYNPAMAGLNEGLNLNTGYRQQWTNLPGAPKTALFTADLQPTDRVGIGLNVNDDQVGIIRQTRIMGSYAYHLPLSDRNDKLSFGLSLGVNDARVDYNKVNGDLSDAQIAQYNQLKAYIDGDFGAAYTGERLTISGAVPNLKTVFFKESDQRFDADRLLFITLASYKFDITTAVNSMTLSPVVAYRKVKGYKDIVDAGFNFAMHNNGIFLQGIYHTSESVGVGMGLDQRAYSLFFNYDFETGGLSNYTTGSFELGLRLHLFTGSKSSDK